MTEYHDDGIIAKGIINNIFLGESSAHISTDFSTDFNMGQS
jgi:hypothetical protein